MEWPLFNGRGRDVLKSHRTQIAHMGISGSFNIATRIVRIVRIVMSARIVRSEIWVYV